jgi:alpha-2-macroglobulin
VEEPIQHFTFANKDTVFNWAFHPNGSEITIDAHCQTLQFLLKDVKYLLRYPYGCNEQTASRLLALLWYKKIKNIMNEQVNVEEDIRFCIQRLENSQNAAGSWGWWPNDQFQPWMSQYVTSALLKAREAGFTVKRLDLALSFLGSLLPAMSWDEQMVVLNLLHKAGVKVDYTPYLEKASIRASFANAQPKDKLDFLQLKQWSKKRIYPSDLYPLLKSDQTSGLYVACGSTAWYDRLYTNTLLAYDIAHQAGWVGITDSITNYWLYQITSIQNTFEKAQILERVLPKYSEYLERKEGQEYLEINGKTYSEFPIQVKVPAASQIRIFKTGNTPLYLTAYQTHHNPDPAPRSDQYAVSTRLLRSNGTPSGTLTYGESATLEVTVKATATSDYVMIEVPIPAGCTYGPKVQPAYRSSPEVHREYFKDRTAIFCTRLPKGTHVFRIPLESRFTGKFTLNPTKVEQMYFPLFYGRNGVQVVEVR